MKKVLLISLALLILLSSSAFATETEPTVGIDTAAEKSELVWLGGIVSYDTARRCYVYDISDGLSFLSNAFDGMVTADPVSILLGTGVNGKLYCNGTEVPQEEFAEITEPGKYVLSVTSNSGIQSEPLGFEIVNSVTGEIKNYALPSGYAFTEVLHYDTPIDFTERLAEIPDEGDYTLTYVCEKTGEEYKLEVTIDRTAPTLELAAVKDGVAKGPVSIDDLEEGAYIRIEKDGKEIKADSTLEDSGKYRVWVLDQAGNSTEYSFRIRPYLNFNAVLFVILFIVLVLALVAYLFYSRKKLRVR